MLPPKELKPQYMMGFGNIPGTTATELNGIAGELQALVSRLGQSLGEGAGQDFQKRLQRLEDAGNDLGLLSRIERVVAERGLVEFRGTIDAILDRAEDRSFEIAVFGRVSSGKSSLLNTVIGTDVLPVGVTPVTAVPTHIIHGEEPSLTISFADAPVKTFTIQQLGEFATEQHNPNNVKHVTRVTVTIPVSRLSEGVSFVDTPGLGSLADRRRCRDPGVPAPVRSWRGPDRCGIHADRRRRADHPCIAGSLPFPHMSSSVKQISSTGLTVKKPSGTSGST